MTTLFRGRDNIFIRVGGVSIATPNSQDYKIPEVCSNNNNIEL